MRTSENAAKAKFVGRLPGTRVDKGERMSCWVNAGRDEDSAPIMEITQSVGKQEVECE